MSYTPSVPSPLTLENRDRDNKRHSPKTAKRHHDIQNRSPDVKKRHHHNDFTNNEVTKRHSDIIISRSPPDTNKRNDVMKHSASFPNGSTNKERSGEGTPLLNVPDVHLNDRRMSDVSRSSSLPEIYEVPEENEDEYEDEDERENKGHSEEEEEGEDENEHEVLNGNYVRNGNSNGDPNHRLCEDHVVQMTSNDDVISQQSSNISEEALPPPKTSRRDSIQLALRGILKHIRRGSKADVGGGRRNSSNVIYTGGRKNSKDFRPRTRSRTYTDTTIGDSGSERDSDGTGSNLNTPNSSPRLSRRLQGQGQSLNPDLHRGHRGHSPKGSSRVHSRNGEGDDSPIASPKGSRKGRRRSSILQNFNNVLRRVSIHRKDSAPPGRLATFIFGGGN